ncbi:MAG: sugar transferase [Flavobacteriaceae bacterium]|nr:sugar transferase [Flavobacteriaceae bacterium]
MLTKKQQRTKRLFDISLAILVLPFVIIPVLLLLLIATLVTGANGLFVQTRIGQFGKAFQLYKIRSLRGTSHRDIVAIKNSTTAFGRWLRNSKLDELPQLFNVLKGEMSWVGPRPDVPGYADKLKGEDRVILNLKPGITGPATLKYKHEDAILLQQKEPLQYNDTVLWPDKVQINKAYIKNWSLKADVSYILQSVFG